MGKINTMAKDIRGGSTRENLKKNISVVISATIVFREYQTYVVSTVTDPSAASEKEYCCITSTLC